MKPIDAKISPVIARIGHRGSGIKRVFLTPELTLIILVAMMEHDRWDERIKAIEEKRPDLKGHFKKKNMIIKAQTYGWPKLIKELKRQMNDKAKSAIQGVKEEALIRVMQDSMGLLKDLEEERDRIREFLKMAEIGTKSYASAVATLKTVNDQIEKLSGMERSRKQDDLKDKVSASLFLAEQKNKMEDEREQLGSGYGDTDEPTFVDDDETQNPFLLQ